ncbi:hypothetical protein P0Y43_00245 [Pseudomonas entomophila]|uniref:hypothetical protein n=1 Tax=Pseudomonas entomophila TaxID=312306 RepID=UPI0023D86D25|nr:hypothetical protein [Pseudomonas entomophila]MDF0729163.1 hypothetical protein [Pseudomonas entomophila]
MRRQRGMVLLLALVLSVLIGLLASSSLRDALLQTQAAGQLASAAQALEQAEASLVDGAQRLGEAPQAPCLACPPPRDAHDLRGGEPLWQRGDDGFFLVQHLGETTRAAHLADGVRVALYRVTAVSRQVRARQVLEAVYALDLEQGGPPHRLFWRQRLREP